MDPDTDLYYYWLCTISIPVFYNLMLLVARSEVIAFFSLYFIVVLEVMVCHGFGFASP